MADDQNHPVNDPIIRAIFRHKVRQLARTPGIAAEDLQDLESELLWQFVRRLSAAGGSRTPRAFANVIAFHGVADFLRHRRARKRDDTFMASLNSPVAAPDGSQAELGDLVSQEEYDASRNVARRAAAETADLALDVAATLKSLPARLRDVAQRLQAGDSVSHIAVDLGLPRTTVSTWLTKIRRVFERAGLADYL